MKDTSFRLISELMKNSRRSDRELAKAVGVSQPTVSRLISKLEKEGFIKEYTMIPDFRKLGYELVALTFVRLKSLTPEELEKARQRTRKDMETTPPEIVWFEKGMGAGSDGILASFHKDYASYLKLRDTIREYSFIESSESFLINLRGDIHYRPLTFSTFADHIIEQEEKEPEQTRSQDSKKTVRKVRPASASMHR